MTSTTPASDHGTDHDRAAAPEDLLSQRPGALEQRVAENRLPRRKPGLTAVLGVVVAAGALFAGGLLVGHATGASATTSLAAGSSGVPGGRPSGAAGFGGGTGASGGITSGTVTAIDGSTVTLTSSDGSTVKISTTDGTTVRTTTDATVADLGVGDTVTVIGQAGSDGTVTARAITEGATGIGSGQVPGQAPTS